MENCTKKTAQFTSESFQTARQTVMASSFIPTVHTLMEHSLQTCFKKANMLQKDLNTSDNSETTTFMAMEMKEISKTVMNSRVNSKTVKRSLES
jgi:hypothetical protein